MQYLGHTYTEILFYCLSEIHTQLVILYSYLFNLATLLEEPRKHTGPDVWAPEDGRGWFTSAGCMAAPTCRVCSGIVWITI